MNSPFKFLDSYTKQDKDIFFGREQEIEELYQKVFESKILLVYGISGTGKSSLIDCGLANKFNDSDWLPINIRRGKDINESLITALSKNALTPFKEIPASAGTESTKSMSSPKAMTIKSGVIPEKAKRISEISLTKTLKSIYLDHFKPIYLIFDQFEEVFIFGSKEERKEFIKNVKKVIESEVQCKFLFVIREEYLAGITEFEKEIADFFSNRMRVEKMNRQNAKQVIEEPCKVYNIEVEKGFAEELIEKLSPESTEVELTYLQVYLDKVFRTA
ncbi:MAG: ATP-binding protein, partial [Bacteroidales bacterium]|nr:ATP-binding protein [Bacteroidales bacterium]